MKLTDFAIDGAGNESGIGLESLHRRLNVVVADAPARRRIRALWARCLTEPAQPLPVNQAPAAVVLGWMRAQVNQRPVRIVAGHAGRRVDDPLNRELAGDLAVLPLNIAAPAALPLAGEQREILERLLTVEADPDAASNSAAALLAAAQAWWQRLNGLTAPAMPWRTESEYRDWLIAAAARRGRLAELQAELVRGENELRSLQAGLRDGELAEAGRRQQELGTAIAREELPALQDALARQEQRRRVLDAEIATLERELAAAQVVAYPHNDELARPVRLAGLLERIDEIDATLELYQKLLAEIQAQRVRLREEAEGRTTVPLDSEEHPWHRAAELIEHLGAITAETATAAGSPEPDSFTATVTQNCERIQSGLRGLCGELDQQFGHVRHRAAVAELKQLRLCHEGLAASVDQLSARRNAMWCEAVELDSGLAAAIRPREKEFLHWLRTEGMASAVQRLTGQTFLISAARSADPDRAALRMRIDATQQQRHVNGLEVQRLQAAIEALQNRLPASRSIPGDDLPWLRQQEQTLAARLANSRGDLARLQLAVDEDSRRPAWKPDPVMQLASQWLEQLSAAAWRGLRWNDSGTCWLAADAAGNWHELGELAAVARRDARFCLALVAQRQCQSRSTPLPLLAELAGEGLADAWLTRLTGLLEQQGIDDHQLIVLTDRWPVLSAGNGPERNDLLRVYDLLRAGQAESTARIVAWQRADAAAVSWPQPCNELLGVAPEALLPATVATETSVRPLIGRFSSSLASFQPVPASALALPQVETAISEETLLQNVYLCPPDLLRLLAAIRVLTIADLLELDPHDPPVALAHASMTPEELDRIQAAAWLMVCVPGLPTDDARLLVDCGITEPEQLEATQAEQLLARLQRQTGLSGVTGRAGLDGRNGRERIQRWYRGLAATRPNWRQPAGYSRRLKRRPALRTSLPDYSDRGEGQGGWFSRPRPDAWRAGEPYFDEQGRSRPGIWREPEDSGGNEEPEREAESWRSRGGTDPRPSFFMDRVAGNGFEPPRATTQPPVRAANVRPLRDVAGFDRNGVGLRRTAADGADRNGHGGDQHAAPATKEPAAGQLRFLLNLDDAVEAAPSIGPKTASKFVQIGVHNIRDFLRTTAESMAERINFKRMTADVIRQWQAQTRLVCRIPNLRDHDAQLLVGVGIDEPEKLEAMTPRQVLDLVGPYADTKEGLKIIRSGKRPDLAEVTDWLRWARNMRSLAAA